jgi:hypothetical protein
MRTYRFNEIENKHGQAIYYWSKRPGNTELEQYKNFKQELEQNDWLGATTTELTVQDNNGNDITCFVDNESGPDGHVLVCFNTLGETILHTDDCYDTDQFYVIESLSDYGKI